LAHFAESCRWSPGRLGSLRRASSSRQSRRAAAWCTTITFLGFVWGDEIADVVDRAGPLVSIVVVVAIVAVVMWNRRRRAHSTA
jgi:hypothetical protein